MGAITARHVNQRDRGRWLLPVPVVVIVLVGTVACGPESRAPTAEPTLPAATTECSLVEAGSVDAVGDLAHSDREIVEWALGRFEEVGLQLPSEIAINFQPNGPGCGYEPGYCLPTTEPPEIFVCVPDGDTAAQQLTRRLTLLHELAHLWHRGQRGEGFSDLTAIVGGGLGADLPWSERMTERVATTISWGLLDQLRRPVRSPFTCAELYWQFIALTGHRPLGPLHGVCVPTALEQI